MAKDFTQWHNIKTELDGEDKTLLFHEREIWWCSVGVNVGHEVDGKGRDSTRPVLVIQKFNRRIFLGVPLTTKIKAIPYYHRITLHNREQCVMLSQVRLWGQQTVAQPYG